ncbi:Methane oxygenase PmoA [Flaviramulus basaltis]|uniref:Methane oxygenase PmoA n=2 Tax=Flaviramulus basaltis TaxID=369401 RepID=A0A1K2IGZ3_9FLAO|nr:Methane oxygenase PmoA [Flaviramulus basaltis]
MYPPKGVDLAYQRSGFFHPINTLKGHQLTRIHPKDHYHHFGMWNPWTKTLFEGDTLDFWNIKEKQATVRHAGFKKIKTTKEYVEYKALHEHLVLKNNKNKIALNEIQTVRVYNPNENYYVIDLQFDYSCATKSEFKILAYRYQGLGWRGTEAWNDENSNVITSEGKTRKDADNTTARWMMYQGELKNEYGGIIMLSHTQNYNHPEPIRVWPIGNHGGSTFVNFNPTKYKDWLFKPGKTYTLKYRLIVFDEKKSSAQAESFWGKYVKNSKSN